MDRRRRGELFVPVFAPALRLDRQRASAAIFNPIRSILALPLASFSMGLGGKRLVLPAASTSQELASSFAASRLGFAGSEAPTSFVFQALSGVHCLDFPPFGRGIHSAIFCAGRLISALGRVGAGCWILDHPRHARPKQASRQGRGREASRAGCGRDAFSRSAPNRRRRLWRG